MRISCSYQGGESSYLEVLDSDTRLFDAELQLVRARLSELAAFVEVYRALGRRLARVGEQPGTKHGALRAE